MTRVHIFCFILCGLFFSWSPASAQTLQLDLNRSAAGVQSQVDLVPGSTIQGAIQVTSLPLGAEKYIGYTIRIQTEPADGIENITFGQGDIQPLSGVNALYKSEGGIWFMEDNLSQAGPTYISAPGQEGFPSVLFTFDIQLKAEAAQPIHLHIIINREPDLPSNDLSLSVLNPEQGEPPLRVPMREQYFSFQDANIGQQPTATPTFTSTVTHTPTATRTDTPIPTATDTPLPGETFTMTPTPTGTSTHTPALTPSPTATESPTATASPTPEQLGRADVNEDGYVDQLDVMMILDKWHRGTKPQ
jgi:hypothetical protein